LQNRFLSFRGLPSRLAKSNTPPRLGSHLPAARHVDCKRVHPAARSSMAARDSAHGVAPDGTKKRDEDSDDGVEFSPFWGIEKGAVLQEARCFNDSQLDPRRCQQVITKLLYLLNQGETFTKVREGYPIGNGQTTVPNRTQPAPRSHAPTSRSNWTMSPLRVVRRNSLLRFNHLFSSPFSPRR
jgi:hypothetical protein